MSVAVIRRVLSNKRTFFKCNLIKRYASEANRNILVIDAHVNIPETSLPEFVYSKIEKFSKYTAFECSLTGRKYTFGDIRIKSRNFSKALRHKLKLQPGDVVAILVQNCPEFPIAALGILEAGLVVTTLNPIYTVEEIIKQLNNSSAKAIITQYELFDNVQKAVAGLQRPNIPIISIKTVNDQDRPAGAISFTELMDARIDVPDFQPRDFREVAALPYSSGTTGLPKGVQLTHYNLVANLCQLTHKDFNRMENPTDTFQDITPGVLPMFHIYGLVVGTLNMMIEGCKVITLPKFTPYLYISVLEKNHINVIFAAPPLVLFLIVHDAVKPEYLGRLKFLMSGAAPLGATDEERFVQKAGRTGILIQGYGLTEASPVVAIVTDKIKETYKNSAGSIGKPIPNTMIKFVAPGDQTGTPLGPKESGELLVKGPQVMKGYLNNPKANEEVFLDGWLRTGDLGHYDEDELIFVTDRIKELIKVKGFQVAPAELEEILRDHSSVADAAVIGVPHPLFGEVPRAYVVPKSLDKFKITDIEAYVNEKVAKYKRLDGGIEVVKTIPKTPSGKILRRALKQKYLQQNS